MRIRASTVLTVIIIITLVGFTRAQEKLNVSSIPACDGSNSRVTIHTGLRGVVTKDYVTNLTVDKFRLSGDEGEYAIKCFSQPDQPLVVGLIIDYSSSSKKESIEQGLKAIARFIEISNDKNVYFAVGFSGSPFLLLAPTEDRKQVGSVLVKAASERTRGKTAFNDGIDFALRNIPPNKEMRRVFIVLSDGAENFSKNSNRNELKSRLIDANVALFVLSPDQEPGSFYSGDFEVASKVHSLVAGTGGWYAKFYDETGIDRLLVRLGRMLRSQYTIGIDPALPTRKWRPFKLEVKLPDNFEQITLVGLESFYF